MKANEKRIPAFLTGGGEMRELIRSFDWSNTTLGSPDKWPQSLQTIIGIILNSKFPMFLWWGPDLICFYNDAYRPSLGQNGKHPFILGMKAEEAWPEIWHITKPLIDQLMSGGESTWNDDQLIPIFRNGKMEDVYWTFSSSAVNDDTGNINGVLVNVIETTDKVKAIKALKESESRFQNLVREANIGIIVLSGEEMRVDVVNEAYGQLIATKPDDLLGRSLFDVIPDAAAVFRPLLNKVRLTGESVYLYDQPYAVEVQEKKIEGYLNVVYQANKESDGTITGVIALCQDVTETLKSRKTTEESEQQMRTMVETAPFPIGVYIGQEMIIQFANQAIINIWGKGNEVIGRSYKTILPELDNQEIFKQLDSVYETGVAYHAKNQQVEIVIDGEIKSFYFDYSFTPLSDANGKIYGVMNTAADITDVNLAKLVIQKSEENLRSTILQAPVAMCILKGKDFNVDLANDRMFEFWGKSAEEVLYKPIFEGLPEAKDQGFEAILQGVYTTGKTFSADGVPINLPRNGVIELVYVNFVYEPYREVNGAVSGILAVAIDVTTQINHSKKMEQSENQFRIFADSIQNLAWTTDADGLVNWFNQRWYDYTGTTLEEMQGSGWKKVHHPEHLKKVTEFIKEAWKKNEAYELTFPMRRYDGEYRWFLTRAYPVKDANGNMERWIGSSTDITEQKNFAEELELKVKERTYQLDIQNKTFAAAEKIAKLGSYKWNMITGSMEYSANLFVLLDCEPNEFEPSFEKFLTFIHPDDLQEVIKNGNKTINNGILGESPYRIISKTGKIKYFRSSGNFAGDKNNGILIGTVQDVSTDIAAAEELRTKNIELENTNAELESFSYIASHDLKEPLRKIQAFGKRIIETETFSEKTQDYFNRIISAGERMQNLIDSLLDFSRANNAELIFEPCDLNLIIEDSKSDLHASIFRKEAVIEAENLPTINGIFIQISQLITNLLDNAIKYSQLGIKPHIKITSSIILGKEIQHSSANNQIEYYAIKFVDNGIGFEQQYTTKIFELFQRLHHKNEYSGTGIGLAIVKKIITNHHGFIIAEGTLNQGSVFTVYIPTL